MIAYHMGWVDESFSATSVDSGKRLRPLILLLVTEALGGDWRTALPAAAAVELLHNFTLVHDDIEDQDKLRRGRPTLWALWGIPQAINAGDALFALSYRSLLDLVEQGHPPMRVNQVITAFTDAVVHITEGQCLDLAFEDEQHVTEDAYLQMVGGKTAALIRLVAKLGALLADASVIRINSLETFGECLGLAFQMQDDLLGLWGDPLHTGKPVGSDIRKRKKTLPLIHGLATSAELRELLLEPELSNAQVDHALRLLELTGSREYVATRAQDYSDRATAALDRYPGQGQAFEALRQLTHRLLDRSK
jgi:geranylgeranyl diphosphate synthase type I